MLRSTLIIYYLIFFSCYTAFAQKGPYAGVNTTVLNSWLLSPVNSNNPDFKYLFSPGYSVGVEGGYYLLPIGGFGGELHYSSYSQRFRLKDEVYIEKLQFFKLPILAVFSVVPKEGRRLRYMSKLGPEIIYLTGAKTEYPDGSTDENAEDSFEEFQIGAVFAVGAGYNLTDRLLLNSYARLDFGMTDIEKDKAQKASITNATTVGLEIGIRYLL